MLKLVSLQGSQLPLDPDEGVRERHESKVDEVDLDPKFAGQLEGFKWHQVKPVGRKLVAHEKR